MATTNIESDQITLDGRIGAVWESSGPFNIIGTVDELKTAFGQRPATGYQIREEGSETNRELVPPEYFYKLGEHLLITLGYNDLIKIVGTLAEKNDHLSMSGRIPLDESHKWYHVYQVIESEEFRNCEADDRMSLFKDVGEGLDARSADQLKVAASWMVASTFMPDKWIYLHGEGFDLADKYPTLQEEIKGIWKTEACEKSIFPYLDKLAERDQGN